MNSAIQLKKKWQEAGNPSRGGGASLPKGVCITLEKITQFVDELDALYRFWHENSIIDGALVSVYYDRIVPKSRRISELFADGNKKSNLYVVGANFYNEKNEQKHVITYYLSMDQLSHSLFLLRTAKALLTDVCYGSVDDEELKNLKERDWPDEGAYQMSRAKFAQIISDLNAVKCFKVPEINEDNAENSVVTLYDTGDNIVDLLNDKLGINITKSAVLSDNTVVLDKSQLQLLKDKASYLLSMSVSDLVNYELDASDEIKTKSVGLIPHPTNEPVVGVIDMLFDVDAYFHEWVEYKEYVSPAMRNEESRRHGTEVTSIIVDGPKANPDLEDGCGRFRVRHFGVAVEGGNSSITIMKWIREIVEANYDIKVWNLSLGAASEINACNISFEASILDELQYKYDVIFIVSGTNRTDSQPLGTKIGAPADSLNSIVVNSTDKHGDMASYSRCGRVLSFFNKPDVCCFGGVNHDKMVACSGGDIPVRVIGTSFAAPWVTRKVAYLIYKMGLSREIAKAMIISAAAGWKTGDENETLYKGYGVVPKHINEIIGTSSDEIRFYVEGKTTAFEMYSYGIPVPKDGKKYHYIAKAVLCYFPECTRSQGVDYTNTELAIQFGRVHNGKIKSLRRKKTENLDECVYEKDARAIFRKWDNIKLIMDEPNAGRKLKPVVAYDAVGWGISVKSMSRLDSTRRETKFGVVVTLKNLDGENKYDEFVKLCLANGWVVNKIDIENRLDIYDAADAEIDFLDDK